MPRARPIGVVTKAVSFAHVSTQTHEKDRKLKRSGLIQEQEKKGIVLGTWRISRAGLG